MTIRQMLRAIFACAILVSQVRSADAASNLVWAGYTESETSLLTTELNSLGSNSNTVVSGSFTTTCVTADIQFKAGGTFTPVAPAYISVWFLRTLDAGTDYEDGSSSVTPQRGADVVIPIRAGTTITPITVMPNIQMPAGQYVVLVKNQTGATLPATGNILSRRCTALSQ